MRARMAIVRTGYEYEHREVVLRDKPQHMLEISPKGTVPVLLLPDGKVLDESIDIMQHVLKWELDDNEKYWVSRNDDEFKFHLDRYKYPNRYEDVDSLVHREAASIYLRDLEEKYFQMNPSSSLSDALFPFVRQFANHDRTWFDAQDWPKVHEWLAANLQSDAFLVCMAKHKQWQEPDVVSAD
tara:strand:+ start:153 stop:701 length:549 start_codon:yes stop_codon:yes gene_type:complete